MYNIVGQRWMALGLTLLSCILVAASVSGAPNTLVRDSIPEQYKWDLSDIYPDWQSWEHEYARASALIDTLSGMQGQASKGAESLLRLLQMKDKAGKTVDRVALYASLNFVTSQADNDLNARNQRAEILSTRQNEAVSWFRPELLGLSWDSVSRWIDQTPGLAEYRYYLENLFRLKAHLLDNNGEKMLSYFGNFESSPDGIYSCFVFSDIKYPQFVTIAGDTTTLTESQVWYQIRTNRNQDERLRMFQTFYRAYDDYVNTYAAMYNSILQRDWALARVRNYGNTLEASLNVDNVSPEVYQSLIGTVRKGVEPLRRYHRLRKQALGVEHYYWTDRQIPLAKSVKTYDYDAVVPDVIAALAPLGPEYKDKLNDLFSQRRIDVYENNDKYTGGFETEAYGTPQYILLNFNGTLEQVFTIAHEAGHAVQGYYSNATQPYINAGSTIFIAEVPSTLNEALLLNYLMAKASTPDERIAMLQRSIEGIEGTFYLQTMFADFEWQAHQLVEKGEPVTAEALRGIYSALLTDYFGDAVEVDSLFYSYWTRISHFYATPYYVYKYATSFAGSAQLVKGILSSNASVREPALKAYFDLLGAGGNDYPMNQLRKCGVDLAKPDAVQAVVDHLNTLVDRLEAELKKQQ